MIEGLDEALQGHVQHQLPAGPVPDVDHLWTTIVERLFDASLNFCKCCPGQRSAYQNHATGFHLDSRQIDDILLVP